MKKTALALTAILTIIPAVRADSLSFFLAHYATDNLFQNRYEEPDQVSLLNFYVDKDLSRFSLYTQGAYTHLYDHSALASYTQDVGADFLHLLNETSALYFSLAGRGTFYRTEYSDYNYFSAGAFMSFKTYLSPTSILKANATAEYKNYSSALYDFFSQDLHITLDKYFQTRTTLKAELAWGHKYFLHPSIEETVVVETHAPGGMGKGMGGPGRGRTGQFQILPESEGRAIQVVSLGGLVAQGLGDSLGLRMTASKQWTVSGENPFSYVEEFYAVENPSYDRFSWSGYQLGGQLTVLFPWNLQFKMGYTISKKEFPGIESLSLEGELLGLTRQDSRDQYEARLEKTFARFSVFLSYVNMTNRSNDPYFDWKGQFFSLGFDWSLPYGNK